MKKAATMIRDVVSSMLTLRTMRIVMNVLLIEQKFLKRKQVMTVMTVIDNFFIIIGYTMFHSQIISSRWI